MSKAANVELPSLGVFLGIPHFLVVTVQYHVVACPRSFPDVLVRVCFEVFGGASMHVSHARTCIDQFD